MLSRAKDFTKFEWLNIEKPLSMKDLEGYIVILDFWTYCCINCMHMLEDLDLIERKYSDKPVIVIGIHSAKFYNEQVKENIESAIERYEINHPVIIDKDMRIWRDYSINAWPTIVIIDPKGNIVYKEAGEGQRVSIEDTINVLLEIYKPTKPPLKFKSVKKERILSFPAKISFSNDLFAVSDSNNNRILIIDLEGRVRDVIGGIKGFRDGNFKEAAFCKPQGVLWLDDKVYVADTYNHAIRVIDLNKESVYTLAGTGEKGWYINNDPKLARLNSPWDLAYHNDYLYIAMAGTHQIWRYNLKDEYIEVFAGSGYEGLIDGYLKTTQFAQPSGLSVSKDILYVADSETSSIRAIDINDKIVRTIVGKDLFIFGYKDGRIDDALFQHPLGLDNTKDKIYVADTYNHAIRVIDLSNNEVYTLLSKDSVLCSNNCNILGLYEPNDVKVYMDGLYIVDTNNHLIRVYTFSTNKLEDLKLKF
jgi:thiol-disulfide isomerase/thioredoxin